MKKTKNWVVIIGVVTAVIAIATAVTGVLLYLEKKRKDNEEIERYIEDSIQ